MLGNVKLNPSVVTDPYRGTWGIGATLSHEGSNQTTLNAGHFTAILFLPSGLEKIVEHFKGE